MKWLIISDIHGYYSGLEKILQKEKDIENIIFLGDGIADIKMAQKAYPNLKFEVVPGNCDINTSLAPMQILTLQNRKVLICHGDGFDVKNSLLALRRAAISMGADIALYGHTHKQYYEYLDGLYLFCPGSVERHISTSFNVSYGIMELSDDGAELYNCEIL